jgi:hypothetical protein
VGSVTYTAAANTTPANRAGTITIGSQSFIVIQVASTVCAYALSPTSASIGAGITTGIATLTTNSGCAWTTTSSATWLTVSPASGSGSGSVSYMAAANTSAVQRVATMTIGGQSFALTQAASASCNFTLAPSNALFGPNGGSGSITVTTGAGCAWTATTSAPWISVSPTSGSGSATVALTVAINMTTSDRTGTVSIGGRLVTISQTTTLGAPHNVHVAN